MGGQDRHKVLTTRAGVHASGAAFWASRRRESGDGVAGGPPRCVWLVADAELIVQAATQPSAFLTIAEALQPLSQEGTLRLQVPFPDGEQHAPIAAAIAADGDQRRQITLSVSAAPRQRPSIGPKRPSRRGSG